MSRHLFLLVASLTLISCSESPQSDTRTDAISNSADSNSTTPAMTSDDKQPDETTRLNQWFEKKYEENILRSPIQLTFLGRPERQGELDDASEETIELNLKKTQADLDELKTSFDYDALTDDAKISYDVWVYQAERELAADVYRYHSYVFEQNGAVHSFFPQLLISFHQVETQQDMENYVNRIKETGRLIDQLVGLSMKAAKQGIRPPYFAYESVIKESQSIISGAPFDDSNDSAVWANTKEKINSLVEKEVIDSATAKQLTALAEEHLRNHFKPAYERLIKWQKTDQDNAPKTAQGASALPNGIAYYEERLANQTTTSLSAEEIHKTGLQEVARLREEMIKVKNEFGFEGSLAEFFVFLRDTKDDIRLYYPNTDEGRQGYLDDSTKAIDNIRTLLPKYFGRLPKADMVVKRVEAFREQDGAAQHYFPSSPDGSRPGIYYAHLSDMTAMPKRELEVIAYHEGLPGHHMQIAIAQELENVPTFRTQANFNAYAEGWGLYSEWLAKEMSGTFADPLSDFGRLGSEMWRAIRLVVDTGLHAKGWSEQQAIEYFMANSAITEAQAISEVRRYLVNPGQATGYKIGMIKIQQLRRQAEQALGEKFDIRKFHDLILGGGSVPMEVLEKMVNQWIAKQS